MDKLSFGTKLWLGLTGYILIGDLIALSTDKETFSSAFRKALDDPRKRKFVTLSWLLTTKHLFFGDYAKWADPFGLMAMGVSLGQRAYRKNIQVGRDGQQHSSAIDLAMDTP